MCPITLKSLRIDAGLSQNDIAKILRVSISLVCKWEAGSRSLSLTPEQTIKMLTILNTNLEALNKAAIQTSLSSDN